MKFRVLKDSYLFRTFYKPGEIVDIADDKLPRDISGNVMFNKMSALEPLEQVETVSAPVADTAPVADVTSDNTDTDVPELNDVSLLEAVKGLYRDNSSMWTLGGLPSLEFLCELFQAKVTRKDVERVAPGFTRDSE